MIVSELIEQLKSYNPNAEITTPYSETIELSYISSDSKGNELTQKDTPIVFIEWRDYEEDD